MRGILIVFLHGREVPTMYSLNVGQEIQQIKPPPGNDMRVASCGRVSH
jgi:hypothetical protein